MHAKSYRPNHRVTIYRQATSFEPEDISADILSLSTTNAYGHGGGGFQIVTTFNKRYENKRYDQLLQTDDRVFIELDKGDGKGLKPVMLGLVDRPSCEENYSNPRRVHRAVKIAGTDMGKMLISHNCGWDIEVKDPNAVAYEGSEAYIRTIEFNGKLSGTPADLVRRVVENFLYKQVPWTSQLILLDQLTTDDDWWTYDTAIAMQTGPIWPFLKDHCANIPWNTLHTDTLDDGKFHIILERTPYAIGDGQRGRLTRSAFYKLDDVDIIRLSLGKSDSEMVNFLLHDVPESVFYENAGSNLLFLGGPSVRRFDADGSDPTSNQAGGRIEYHGFRLHKIKCEFSGDSTPAPVPLRIGNGGANPNVHAAVKKRTDAYWNWFSCNHLLESGTIVVKGDPDIRSGAGILRVSGNMEYLAERVNHDYVWGGSFTTTIGVTRGQSHQRR